MTSPRHAEATAKGRYYSHPQTGEQLISVTNVLSVSCAKPALVPWAAKIAAEWAIEHLPSLVKMSRTDPDQATKNIKAQVTVARDKAADLGSAVHAAAERHALGQPPIDDEYAEQVKPFLTKAAGAEVAMQTAGAFQLVIDDQGHARPCKRETGHAVGLSRSEQAVVHRVAALGHDLIGKAFGQIE